MMNLDSNDFKKLGIAQKETDKYLTFYNAYLHKFEINTPNRLIAFFSNILLESKYLIYAVEIASGADYEGNKNLGNTQKGDGVRFKGRGHGQITGRSNYEMFTTWVKKTFGVNIDFVKNPEKVAEPQWAVLTGFWYWQFRKLHTYADKGDFNSVHAVWNTGRPASKNINGLRDRVDIEKKVINWLSSIIDENV